MKDCFRTIIHVDMDCFFAAVEQRDNPKLRGKPVIICGSPDRRSVVATASYEARKFGIQSGSSAFSARLKCPNAAFVEGNPDKYLYASSRLIGILKDYTSEVEVFSIDEAFLDISGCEPLFGPPESVAWSMKERVKKELGLTCSVGIAPNKLVAKIASGLHKPDGLTVVLPGEEQSFLGKLPVGKLWGVGEKTQRVLNRLGVRTVFDLTLVPKEILTSHFGVIGECLYFASRGIDNSPIIPYYNSHDAKSMGHEHTFDRDVNNPRAIFGTLLWLCEKLGRRLRKGRYFATNVTVKLRFADFTTITRALMLRTPTNLEGVIFSNAKRLLLASWKERRMLRLIGVTGGGLVRAPCVQLELFGIADNQRYRRMVEAADRIRDRFGERAIRHGGSLSAYAE
ncbi:MAG TPA: DNA polymerase IV [bacterium]|nr:DNA polymerase IV [bacterium]